MSGNKGAVAIRFDFHDTAFCFVTAHLAAGHTNVDERNMDYRTVVNGLHFLKGKNIQSHQYASFPLYRCVGDWCLSALQERHMGRGYQLPDRLGEWDCQVLGRSG